MTPGYRLLAIGAAAAVVMGVGGDRPAAVPGGVPRHIPMYAPDGQTLIDSGEAVSAIINHRRVRVVSRSVSDNAGTITIGPQDSLVVVEQIAPASQGLPIVPTTVTFTCSNGLDFEVKDGVGNDSVFPITLQSASGAIDGQPKFVMQGSVLPTAANPGSLETRRVTCDGTGRAWLTDNANVPTLPIVVFDPPNPTLACNAPAGTVVSKASMIGGDGQPADPSAWTITAGDTSDFAVANGNVVVGPANIALVNCNKVNIVTVKGTQQ